MSNLISEIDASTQNEQFLREFILIYKENRLLWDKEHPYNTRRDERAVALEDLLKKCKEYHPKADLEFVTNKIKTLRTIFRKEYRKVVESQKVANSTKGIYKPSLWYYDLLLFTVGEDIEGKCKKPQARSKVSCWNRDYTIILIDLLKKHPVLYVTSSKQYNKTRCRESVFKITKNLSRITGRKFSYADVAKKIHMLKYQYKRCCIQLKKSHRDTNKEMIDTNSKLWCFDLLHFLRNPALFEKKSRETKQNVDISNSDEDDDNLPLSVIKQEYTVKTENNIDSGYSKALESNDDNYKNFNELGKRVATQLRDMSEHQRFHCEKIINELMFHGLMENLSGKSALVICDEI